MTLTRIADPESEDVAMTLTRIADPESIERQGKLLAAMDASAAFWREKADSERERGHGRHALVADALVWRCEQIANKARKRMVAVAAIEQPAPGLADVLAKLPSDEPAASCPLASCESWSATAPAVEHVVIDQPEKGYRIHLFHRTPAQPDRRVGWVARLRGWLAGRWPR